MIDYSQEGLRVPPNESLQPTEARRRFHGGLAPTPRLRS
jgi:hypothetical protein